MIDSKNHENSVFKVESPIDSTFQHPMHDCLLLLIVISVLLDASFSISTNSWASHAANNLALILILPVVSKFRRYYMLPRYSSDQRNIFALSVKTSKPNMGAISSEPSDPPELSKKEKIRKYKAEADELAKEQGSTFAKRIVENMNRDMRAAVEYRADWNRRKATGETLESTREDSARATEHDENSSDSDSELERPRLQRADHPNLRTTLQQDSRKEDVGNLGLYNSFT
jgi:hypothetical protein